MTTPQNHQMYGDLVGVFINIAAVVLNINILAHLLQENDYSLRATAGPLSVFSCQLALGFFSVWSFWFQKRFASYAAFASNLSLVSLICTHQWPAAVAPLLTPMFVWQLVVLSANTPHSFFAKLCMALAAASVATLTSVLSSIHSVQKNVGPIVAFTGTSLRPLVLPS